MTSTRSGTRSRVCSSSRIEIARLGANAVSHVVDNFVGDRHLLKYSALLAEVLGVSRAEGRSE